MRKETLHEAELDALTLLAAGTRRLVEGNDRQPGKIDAQIPAFSIDVRNTDAFHDLDRLMTRVDADAAVAFLLGAMEMPFEAADAHQLFRDIAGLGFELLDTNEIGSRAREPRRKTLAGGRTDAIQVQRYNSHHSKNPGACENDSRACLQCDLRNVSADFRQDFIRFALEQNVLCFGEFKTKAGRVSPYFFNAGLFHHG